MAYNYRSRRGRARYRARGRRNVGMRRRTGARASRRATSRRTRSRVVRLVITGSGVRIAKRGRTY